MFTLAKSVKGHEYLYRAETAHKVAKAKAHKIAEQLNAIRYDLKPGEVWFVHEIDQYDVAYWYANEQSFVWGVRGLRRKYTPGF